ncbi:MAG: M20/M25/M40 family metallo-hydrolase, partial [Anaerolineales bacterium]|nr:M20/M25/M40 family metallo-hydrolase [Anaerolineales bacterium]
AGSPEGHATGDYITEEYKKYGLQPFGENGTFFQNFTATFTPLSEIPTFEIEEPDGTINNDYKIYQDYSPIIRWYAGSGETQGQVYWVNDCSKDQFAEIDVVGKIILCEPGDHTDWMVDSLRNTLEHGAYGLLLIGDPLDRPPDFASPTKDIWIPETIPAFWVYPELIQGLLSGSGKTLEDLSLSTETYPLKTQVNLKVSIDTSGSCPGTRCPARNVLGILPGRDPGFASEVVILGAHYDHMGQGPDGTIWSGANDNASGVAVLLEIARSWQEQGYVPRRSVIFAAWDAEEIGLLGSRHYVETPLYPLANTLAMIQLDMVGAGTETLSIDGDSELSDHIERVAQMLEVPTSITHIGRSDHTPFLEAGIPSSLLIWYGDDTSTHYHQPADTIEVIDPPKLENVAKITQITILDIVESAPAIINLLVRRSQAAETGDLTSFLSTSHIDQNEIDRIWFNDLMTLSPTSIEIEANELIITGEHAQASTNINIEYLEAGSEGITQTLSAKIPAQLSLDSNGWKWAGPYLQWYNANDLSETSHLTVAIPPGAEISIDGIVQTVSEQYKDIATTLNLPTYFDAKLFLMPDAKSIQASTALS